ncbi:hypothetical protein COT44_03835 [Candidatus Shapirobacteria bacterium CG08_land_8_20_14_0_20_39_18]|uniref:Uncharacterized protein n=1 Tax=Candidatus Shapirobacteria bacterium CG08_land_8_20_14_0_20_39_18 TaxID=1974883 RepID=A0A2M6XCI0_9BACT|nr:MAG: hypothetical protein COT44_03835 [Candidatus Shapirobacteria bacterium CG08_land_8_20_14_0_20_39_18]PIY65579.1 MAG: hypothetical protein COY91_02220 [Candidatus Shapirobacteria bacterium CG_4_10_14_0_8_um_filter_39_15]PJE68797.1 MAG: hypothetical protein COU94_00295 [Candidatus Shapirobacteria bacterium CG10_big_fil_rev_8_21_14_0_10_38_8]
MAGEFGDVLGNVQDKLSDSGLKRIPDMVLTVVTDELEIAPKRTLQKITIKRLPEQRLSISIGNEEQLDLGTMLPNGVDFVAGSDFIFNKGLGRLTIPTDKESVSRGLWFRMSLAHEIGHGLDSEYDKLDLQSREEGDSFAVQIRKENALLKMEVNAWNSGKAIADIMGIDEIKKVQIYNPHYTRC